MAEDRSKTPYGSPDIGAVVQSEDSGVSEDQSGNTTSQVTSPVVTGASGDQSEVPNVPPVTSPVDFGASGEPTEVPNVPPVTSSVDSGTSGDESEVPNAPPVTSSVDSGASGVHSEVPNFHPVTLSEKSYYSGDQSGDTKPSSGTSSDDSAHSGEGTVGPKTSSVTSPVDSGDKGQPGDSKAPTGNIPQDPPDDTCGIAEINPIEDSNNSQSLLEVSEPKENTAKLPSGSSVSRSDIVSTPQKTENSERTASSSVDTSPPDTDGIEIVKEAKSSQDVKQLTVQSRSPFISEYSSYHEYLIIPWVMEESHESEGISAGPSTSGTNKEVTSHDSSADQLTSDRRIEADQVRIGSEYCEALENFADSQRQANRFQNSERPRQSSRLFFPRMCIWTNESLEASELTDFAKNYLEFIGIREPYEIQLISDSEMTSTFDSSGSKEASSAVEGTSDRNTDDRVTKLKSEVVRTREQDSELQLISDSEVTSTLDSSGSKEASSAVEGTSDRNTDGRVTKLKSEVAEIQNPVEKSNLDASVLSPAKMRKTDDGMMGQDSEALEIQSRDGESDLDKEVLPPTKMKTTDVQTKREHQQSETRSSDTDDSDNGACPPKIKEEDEQS